MDLVEASQSRDSHRLARAFALEGREQHGDLRSLRVDEVHAIEPVRNAEEQRLFSVLMLALAHDVGAIDELYAPAVIVCQRAHLESEATGRDARVKRLGGFRRGGAIGSSAQFRAESRRVVVCQAHALHGKQSRVGVLQLSDEGIASKQRVETLAVVVEQRLQPGGRKLDQPRLVVQVTLGSRLELDMRQLHPTGKTTGGLGPAIVEALDVLAADRAQK